MFAVGRALSDSHYDLGNRVWDLLEADAQYNVTGGENQIGEC